MVVDDVPPEVLVLFDETQKKEKEEEEEQEDEVEEDEDDDGVLGVRDQLDDLKDSLADFNAPSLDSFEEYANDEKVYALRRFREIIKDRAVRHELPKEWIKGKIDSTTFYIYVGDPQRRSSILAAHGAHTKAEGARGSRPNRRTHPQRNLRHDWPHIHDLHRRPVGDVGGHDDQQLPRGHERRDHR